jgi:hypothetical protein
VSAERRNVPAVVEARTPVKWATLRSTLAVRAVIAGAGDHAAALPRILRMYSSPFIENTGPPFFKLSRAAHMPSRS